MTEEGLLAPIDAATGRVGKRAIQVWTSPEVLRQLKLIAIHTDRTVQDLMCEALDMLFEAHGLPKIASGKREVIPEASLYHSDFFEWTQRQAEALRDHPEASNSPLDWAHLAEEIEGLGKSERRTLERHIRTVVEHLLKIQFSPATDPRAGWRGIVIRARRDIASLLKGSPSLRPKVAEIIGNEAPVAAKVVALDLDERGEIDASALTDLYARVWAEIEVLGPA